MSLRKSLLLEENIFNSSKDFEKLNLYLSNVKKFNYLKQELSISDSLILENIHTIELQNWIKYLMNDI